MNLSYRNQRNAEITASHWKKPLNKPEWFSIENMSDEIPEIFIYDVIGWPYNDIGELVNSLSYMKGKTPVVRINSPGGDVFDGMALYNAFANHPSGVNIRIESLAASMASVIAMSGRSIDAYPNTMMMIHNSWTVVAGNKNDLKDTAELLGKIDVNILDTYAEQTKVGKREIKSMMDAETWLTATDMKEKGFIDNIIKSGSATKAKFDLSVFANCPDDIRGEGRDLTERDAERILRDAGFSKGKAKALLAGRLQGNSESDEIAALKTLLIFEAR